MEFKVLRRKEKELSKINKELEALKKERSKIRESNVYKLDEWCKRVAALERRKRELEQ